LVVLASAAHCTRAAVVSLGIQSVRAFLIAPECIGDRPADIWYTGPSSTTAGSHTPRQPFDRSIAFCGGAFFGFFGLDLTFFSSPFLLIFLIKFAMHIYAGPRSISLRQVRWEIRSAVPFVQQASASILARDVALQQAGAIARIKKVLSQVMIYVWLRFRQVRLHGRNPAHFSNFSTECNRCDMLANGAHQ
jgi:hypothetical protein